MIKQVILMNIKIASKNILSQVYCSWAFKTVVTGPL